MKIVIDTNVLISGVFFGGFPRKILRASVERRVKACANMEILNEYQEIIREMISLSIVREMHRRCILSVVIKICW